MEIFLGIVALILLALSAWTIQTVRVIHAHYKPECRLLRFPKMVNRLGMSVDEIIKSDIAYHLPTAQRLCGQCEKIGECDMLLGSHQTLRHAPSFCPNAAYLRMAKHRAAADN